MSDKIVVGLDIGTTKVCAVVATSDELDRVQILGVGVAESEGLNRGVVVNIDKTVAAVRAAIEEAERMAGVTVRNVIVGIAGDHVQSFQSRGVITISSRDGEISENDVQRLLEDTTHVAMPADREILHVIPQEFIVDGQDGVADPIGMSGVRLEANVHIITGLVSAAKNIYRCVEKSGYEVADIVLEPLGSSFAVLHKDEKEVGVALIDIGGGTTETALISLGGVVALEAIRVGSFDLDNAIQGYVRREYGIAVGERTAEEIKILLGSAAPTDDEVSAEIRGRELMSGLPKTVVLTPEEVRSAIEEPVTAMVDSVLSCLAQAPPELAQDLIVEGIHLVGGGGLLRGMDLRLAQDSEVMVRRVQSPLETVVLGAGKVIEHYESVQAMFMEGNASGRRR